MSYNRVSVVMHLSNWLRIVRARQWRSVRLIESCREYRAVHNYHINWREKALTTKRRHGQQYTCSNCDTLYISSSFIRAWSAIALLIRAHLLYMHVRNKVVLHLCACMRQIWGWHWLQPEWAKKRCGEQFLANSMLIFILFHNSLH